MILFLHNRYRTLGGEEQAVEDLLWLVRERLGEDAELLERDSAATSQRQAAAGMLRGGVEPHEVYAAVRRTGARIVHAHNVNPTFGWRALAAARAAGARVVLHLHQYRLVCAIGTCFRDGHDCTRCHGRNTLPGVRLNCRGSVAEATAYGLGLSLWQRRLGAQVDAFVVPSRFAHERLQQLGASLGRTFVVPHVVREIAETSGHRPAGPVLVAARLSAEKGVEVAVEACHRAGMELLVAGDGPEQTRLERLGGAGVRLLGRTGSAQLARLRREAGVAAVPSLAAETFGLAAAEAMAAGLPVVASRVGALPELVPEDWLVPPGDPAALADALRRVRADPEAGERALQRARVMCAPQAVGQALDAVYEWAGGARA